MGDDPSEFGPIVDLANEYLERFRRGERPTVTEYVHNHPEYAEKIRKVFPMMALMENNAPDATHVEIQEDTQQDEMPLARLGDFRILREVGRGGMGVVYEAIQDSLGRRVALKVFPSHSSMNPRLRERFKRESRSAALLHHTNIVPVFAVGDEDGILYYAMQFIDGAGLDDVIDELKNIRQLNATARTRASGDSKVVARSDALSSVAVSLLAHGQLATEIIGDNEPHSDGVGTNDSQPGGDHSSDVRNSAVHLPGQRNDNSLTDSGHRYWLSVSRVAEQVAAALAYAHERGTLHRDIKPANLLLDQNATVWVTDFGLAKSIEQDDLTNTGELVGTLRYMAPERFKGHSDKRSDVYSLGLTLYELVTLRPAFQSTDRHSLIQKVLNETPPRPRKVISGVPRDLETIILKATAAEPSLRYQSAGELQADLGRFLQDKPIRARRASWAEHAWRWCRRNPSAAALVASLALLLAGTIAAGFWYVQDQAQRKSARAQQRSRFERDIELELEKAETLSGKARLLCDRPDQWKAMLVSAQSAAGRAQLLLNSHSQLDPALVERVHRCAAGLQADEIDWRLVTSLESIRLDAADVAFGQGRFATVESIPRYRDAFDVYGLSPTETTAAAAAGIIQERPGPVRLAIVTALDDWIFWSQYAANDEVAWLEAVVDASDADPWRRQVRQAVGQGEDVRAALEALADQVNVGSQPPATLRLLAISLRHCGAESAAIELLQRAQTRYPADFWVNQMLGYSLLRVNPRDAARFYTAAFALRPDSAGALLNVGRALSECGDTAGAIDCYEQAIRIAPSYALAYNNLGVSRHAIGENDLAMSAYRQAISINPDYPDAHNNVGVLLMEQGETAAAIASYHAALELNPRYARARSNLGIALHAGGDATGAIEAFRRSIDDDPFQADTFNAFALALMDQQQWEAAVDAEQEAIDLQPKNAEYRFNLGLIYQGMGNAAEAAAAYQIATVLDRSHARSHYNLGLVHDRNGAVSEAIAAYRRAITVEPEHAQAHNNLGRLLRITGDVRGAIAAFRRVIEIEPTLAVGHKNLSTTLIDQRKYTEAVDAARNAIKYDPEFAAAYANLATALIALGDVDAAIAACHQAIDLDPHFGTAHNTLGRALRQKGELTASIKACRQAIQCNPNDADAHMNLGIALLLDGDPTAAVAAHRKAVELEPQNGRMVDNLGVTLRSTGRHQEALKMFERAVEVNPAYDRAYYNLGSALQSSDPPRAAEAYRRTIELNPRHAQAHVNLATIVLAEGDPSGAVELIRQAIRIDPELLTAHLNLGSVLESQGDLEGAVAAYMTALEVNPQFAEALYHIGRLQVRQSDFAGAIVSLERADELGSEQPTWRYSTAPMIRDCQRYLELEPQLPAIFDGEIAAAGAMELIDLAKLCYYKQWYGDSASFFEQAFVEQQDSPPDLTQRFRYWAACSAAQAGCGQGESGNPDRPRDDESAARWRGQALEWLRTDLSLRAEQLISSPPDQQRVARQELLKWQRSNDLAGVRDPTSSAAVPESERLAWQQLWSDVAAALATP